MGVLYDAMKLKKKMKREMVLDRLLELGVKEYEGKSVQDIEYDQLKTILVLAEMRQVDIENPEHRWFR